MSNSTREYLDMKSLYTEYTERIKIYLAVFSAYLLIITIYIFISGVSSPPLISSLLFITLLLVTLTLSMHKTVVQQKIKKYILHTYPAGFPAYRNDDISTTVSQIVSDPDRLIAINALYKMQRSQDPQLWQDYITSVMKGIEIKQNVANSKFVDIRKNLENILYTEMSKQQSV